MQVRTSCNTYIHRGKPALRAGRGKEEVCTMKKKKEEEEKEEGGGGTGVATVTDENKEDKTVTGGVATITGGRYSNGFFL